MSLVKLSTNRKYFIKVTLFFRLFEYIGVTFDHCDFSIEYLPS